MKKKIVALFLSGLMTLSVIPTSALSVVADDAATETPTEIEATYDWYTGVEKKDGVSAYTYEIDTIGDLAGLAKITNGNGPVDENGKKIKDDFADDVVKLTADLTFADSEYLYYQSSDSNTALYDYRIATFAGTFDGQGKTIKGLKFYNANITQSPNMYLFQTISATGSVQDLTLDTVTADINGYDHFGFLAKNLNGTATKCHVENATANVAVHNNNNAYLSSTGAMFGSASSATITDCRVDNFRINAPEGGDTTDLVGALVGSANGVAAKPEEGIEANPTVISNCAVSDVTFVFARKTKRTGGFIGSTSNTTITDCTATNVTISVGTYYQTLGGFVGSVGSGSVYENCKLNGFTLNADSTDYAGYVGGFASEVSGSDVRLTGCSVTDLDMDLEFRYKNYGDVGGFISKITGTVAVENCSVSGEITAVGIDSNLPIGGFVGATYNTPIVSGCTANVAITTPYGAGGFVGVSNGGTFTGCEAKGNVSGDISGGFAGASNSGSFENCEANGNVDGNVAGGFCGKVEPDSPSKSVTIESCAANGTVTGSEIAAGFVGSITTSGKNDEGETIVTEVTIQNSSASPAVSTKTEDGTKVDFATETVPDGSTSHFVSSGNAVRFDKEITITATSETAVGENVSVSINVTGDGTFNACELELTYDAEKLTFNKTASTLNGGEVTVENGVLKLVDYGEAQKFGNGIYILVFTAIKGGAETTTIALTSAGFGTSASAETKNLAKVIDYDALKVAIAIKHAVKFDTEGIFAGETSVKSGENYTFSIEGTTGAYYDYQTPTATMDGVEVSTEKIIYNGDGTWTVENVTGDLVISGTRTPKTYKVTIDGAEVNSATYGEDYSFELPAGIAPGVEAGTKYSVDSVQIGGKDEGWTEQDGIVTITGKLIIGEVVIKTKEIPVSPTMVTVTVNGNGAGEAKDNAKVANMNESYTLTLVPEAGYVYDVKAEGFLVVKNGYSYRIDVKEENVIFTVTRTVDVESAKVSKYVSLGDSNTIWLVTIGNEKLADRVYTYDGQVMFWSERYNAYVTLVVSSEEPATTADKFDIIAGTATELLPDAYDVNMSGSVDANDAQLVWNMYNSQYNEFTKTVPVEKFLLADVNGDKVVDTQDAAKIVIYILPQ